MTYPPIGYLQAYPMFDVTEYYDQYSQLRKRYHAVILERGDLVWLTPSRVMECFDIIDSNHDGFIDLTEWRFYMAQGQLSGPGLTQQQVDNILGALDAGDPAMGGYGAFDGKLSYEEFALMFTQNIDLLP
ncbi:MAG: EF-hand domain-containing protein [Thiobacillus sp.]|nr:EF-hand domain-containing protein [Thiobacillus sp.]